MPIFPSAPVRVQPYFGHRSPNRLSLSARALKSGNPRFEANGRMQAMRTMLAQFASREAAGVDVTLEIAQPDGTIHHHSGTSDKEGFVHFDIALEGAWPLPAQTSWETATLRWTNDRGNQTTSGHVLVPGSEVDLGIISDIDDTIIETGITGGIRSVLRNWRRVLQQMPEQRVAVPGADKFYNAIGGGSTALADGTATGQQVPATKRPFFYVSSSPWNLYSYLVSYKRSRGVPLGPIHLRDWGLNEETFGSSSHGSHKVDAIRAILNEHAQLRFVLIGDDSQGDLVAFGDIAQEFGERVAAIFIRRVGEDLSSEEEAAKAAITGRNITLWMGDSFAIEQDFLEAAGLGYDDAAQKIVELTQEGASSG